MAEAMAAVADSGPAAKKKACHPRSEDQDRRKASFATWQTSPACANGIACVNLKCLEDYYFDDGYTCTACVWHIDLRRRHVVFSVDGASCHSQVRCVVRLCLVVLK
jgi:hypothetical protein